MSYTTFTNNFRVTKIERDNNSRNGNPRFKFIFDNNFEMKTPVDAGWVYAIVPDSIEGEVVRVKYRTKRGGYEILGLSIPDRSTKHIPLSAFN